MSKRRERLATSDDAAASCAPKSFDTHASLSRASLQHSNALAQDEAEHEALPLFDGGRLAGFNCSMYIGACSYDHGLTTNELRPG